MAQFGVSAIHLLKQRLLEELKNELLFSNLNVSQLADEFHFSDPSHLMRFSKRNRQDFYPISNELQKRNI